jgi:hypothetical protein
MRIISPPISEMPLRPVEAPQGIRNRVPRDSAPGTNNKVSDSTNSASGGQRVSTAGAAGATLSAGNPATVGAGVTAPKVFHAPHGGPAETSLPEVSRAYTKTDSLRFKDVPFTVRVV